MYLNDDGIRLSVRLNEPDNAKRNAEGKMPICIVVHGFSGYTDEPHILAATKAIYDAGFATLNVDMYGHGESDGTFKEHTLFKWMGNMMCVIDYVRKLDKYSDIYLCGHSQGGLMVLLAAALKHEFIRGIVMLSPALMIPDEARRGDMLGHKFDPANIPEEIDFDDGFILGNNYVRVAQTIDVNRAIDAYDGEVLIIHGDDDETCSLSGVQKFMPRFKNAELIVIPDETHCYDRHLDQVVMHINKHFSSKN